MKTFTQAEYTTSNGKRIQRGNTLRFLMIDDDLFNQRETILWVYRQKMHTIEMYKKKKK